MKFRSNLEIHFFETWLFMVVSLILFCIFSLLYSYVELKVQTSTVAYKDLLVGNIYFSVALWLIFHIGYFVSGWYSDILGGELRTGVIFNLIGAVVLTYIKYTSFESLGYACKYYKTMIGLPVGFITSPMMLIYLYIDGMGKGYTI